MAKKVREKSELEIMSKKASELGMSYGQYVAMQTSLESLLCPACKKRLYNKKCKNLECSACDPSHIEEMEQKKNLELRQRMLARKRVTA